MAKARRVFQIARELGVDSKAILEKCRAEGLDLQNHMSTVTIGLEATIREWFTEGDGGTAVETAEKVDITAVKAKARRRKAITPAAHEPEEEEDQHAEVAEPAAEEATTEAPAEVVTEQPVAEPVVEQPPVAAPTTPEAPAPAPEPAPVEPQAAPEPPAEPVEPAEAPAAPVRPAASAQPAAPKAEPKPVAPAGPQLARPQAAKLKGPRVVRIEEPEKLERPRVRRGPGGPMGGGPGGGPQPPDVMRSTGPVRGKGAGARPSDRDDEAGRSPRRRTAGAGGAKKGRTGDADLWFKGARREQDLIEREERLSHAAGFLKRRRRDMKRAGEGGPSMSAMAAGGGVVEIAEPITIKDLSAATGIKGADIIKFLFKRGVMATINAVIDTEAAMEICLENNIELRVKEAQTAEEQVLAEIEQRERSDERRRPPIVAVLGHVDHGKTSLLDRIRSTDVASGEAGGITQHIGAFRATIVGTDGNDKTVVFLDTPGHQAFTNMRARGANLADLVVLVVAADDGVMPQTIESINHAKAAGTRIVVALNKIDRPDATEANVTKILGQLAEHGLNPVEWGGETEVMKVSAVAGTGVKELIEVLDYQAELLELTADYAGTAYGQVIEAELDPGRGPVARVLVQEGQLRVGDMIVIGRGFGKIRSMIDDHGTNLDVAGPATPVEISGIDEVPDAGDKMYAVPDGRRAEEIASQRRDLERKQELAAKTKVTLANVFEQMKSAEVKELRVVIKADMQGSVEVLRKTLEDLSNDKVRVKVLHAAVGGITESDVLLAEASDAVIIGFEVIASAVARAEAERRGVDVRTYRIIYEIVDDVKRALEGMLSPEKREQVLGHAEVRDVFRVSKVGAVAGCYVTDGVVRRNALIRVTRDGIVVEHDRTLESLKRFKEDAREVRAGMECGCKIEAYDDIREGDVLECYITTEVRPTLS